MCLQPLVLRILYYCKVFLNVLRFVIPMVLIIKIIIQIYKQMIDPNSKEGFDIIKTRVIAAIIIFLVPTVVSVLISLISDTTGNKNADNFSICLEFANLESIKNLEEEISKKEEQNSSGENNNGISDLEIIDNVRTRNESDKSNSGKTPTTVETITTSNIIFVGDSRTVGMCKQISLPNTEKCVAEVSQSIDWFNSTAINKVNDILNNNPNKTYNIIIDLGVNKLSKPDKYTSSYNNLKTGKWSKHNIIITSVTPVNEKRYEAKYHNQNFNSKIQSFNNSIRSGLSSNIKYCNIYDKVYSLMNNGDDDITSGDGLHYTTKGYINIYKLKKQCI